MNKTVGPFIPEKAHKIFLHTNTNCMCPSETFCASYPIFSIVVFRKMTSAEQTVSVTYLFLCQIVSERTARSLSESDGVSDGDGSWQTLLFRLFDGPRKAFSTSQLVLDLVPCLIFFFWVASTNFLCGELVIFFIFPPRGLALVSAWHRADIWWSERQQKWTVKN
jgi:hypothetical protein